MKTITDIKPLLKTAGEMMSYLAYCDVSFDDAKKSVVKSHQTNDMKQLRSNIKSNNNELEKTQQKIDEIKDYIHSFEKKPQPVFKEQKAVRDTVYHQLTMILLFTAATTVINGLGQPFWLSLSIGMLVILATRGIVAFFIERKENKWTSWRKKISYSLEVVFTIAISLIFLFSYFHREGLTTADIITHTSLISSLMIFTTFLTIRREKQASDELFITSWIVLFKKIQRQREIENKLHKNQCMLPKLESTLKNLRTKAERLKKEYADEENEFAESLIHPYMKGRQFKERVESNSCKEKIDRAVHKSMKYEMGVEL